VRSQEKLPPKEWWPRVKHEFHVFLCTDDAKYEDLREKLRESASVTSTTVLSAIAAAIGSTLGFEAGAIVGLVAVCIYAAIKIGKEAYCAAST
jgi:ABC-type antimicrobial peptide transport system permease subunit